MPKLATPLVSGFSLDRLLTNVLPRLSSNLVKADRDFFVEDKAVLLPVVVIKTFILAAGLCCCKLFINCFFGELLNFPLRDGFAKTISRVANNSAWLGELVCDDIGIRIKFNTQNN